MDSSLPHTLSSQDLLSQNNATASGGTGLSTSAPIATPSQPAGALSNPAQNGGDPGAIPVKRKPGRPKGSVKKPTPAGETSDPATKVKRPVGRPRKDGLPAGSVNPGARASRPRKSAPAKMGGPDVQVLKPGDAPAGHLGTPTFGIPQPGPTFRPYYPPNQLPPQAQYQNTFAASMGMQPSISAPPIATLSHSNGTGPVSPQLMYPIDPALERDEWANLAKTNHSAFLQTLLVSLAAPNPISTAGPSVEEAFKSHLVSLAPNPAQKDAQSIPSLYSILKSFWLPSSPAYFSLTTSASMSRTPSEHRFLYWDPQPLVFNGIACPVCSAPLINRGRIRSGPMKVYDLEKPFFIVGCEYICKGPVCVANVPPDGRKFASTDSSILRSLPARLRDEFPAYLMQGDGDLGSGANVWNWEATGVSRSLWNMVRGCLRSGLSRDSIMTIVRAIQNGVPDEQSQMEEEEEADEQDELDQEQPAPNNSTAVMAQPVAPPAVNDTQTNGASDAYNNAWKAHSAVMDPSPNPEPNNAQAGPSMPTGTTMTMAAQSVPQPYPFPQAGPYIAYPYQPYPHYPVQQQQQPAAQSSNNAQQQQQQPSSDSGSPEQNALKRPFSYGDNSSEVSILEPSQKRTRHCCKCGSQECKGKGGRSFCLNMCQDCGKLECKGRNSRRPDKRCDEAWS